MSDGKAWRLGWWWALAAALLGGPAGAEVATLVADLTPNETRELGSAPGDLVRMGEKILFAASSRTSGDGKPDRELWTYDLDTERAEVLADTCPGPCPGSPVFVAKVRGLTYWTAHAGGRIERLWRSDGSLTGTFPLLVTSLDGRDSSTALPFASGLLVATSRGDLWRTDGSTQGTRFVSRLGPLGTTSFPGDQMVQLDDGRVVVTFSRRLFLTDGTAQGTRWLESTAGRKLSARLVVPLGDRVLAVGRDQPTGWNTLWSVPLDGEPAQSIWGKGLEGPLRLTNWIVEFEERVYFLGQERGLESRRKLYESDGTARGTRSIAEGLGPMRPERVSGQLLLIESTAEGSRLWSLEPSPSRGLVAIGSSASNPSTLGLARQGSSEQLYFSAFEQETGNELWRTDGSVGSVERLSELCPGRCDGVDEAGGVKVGAGVLFWGQTGRSGAQLFRVGSSDAMPRRVSFLDAEVFPAKAEGGVVSLGDRIFIAAGREIWEAERDDPRSTRRVTWIGAHRSGSSEVRRAVDIPAGVVLFESGRRAVMRLNLGTRGPEVLLEDRCQSLDSLVASGGLAFFGCTSELWRTDGEVEGTLLLTPGFFDFPILFSRTITVSDGRVYFPVDVLRERFEPEIWSSDGASEGTGLAFEAPSLGIRRLSAVGERLILVYPDVLWGADPTSGALEELFVSDDDRRLREVGLLADSTWWSSLEERFLDGPPRYCFLRTNGTAAGTRTLVATDPLAFPVFVAPFAGGLLYFADAEGPGGTLTHLLSDDTFLPLVDLASVTGADATTPAGVFFVADDGVHGLEPWFTDGTPGGTRLVRDVLPGELGSSPTGLLAAGDEVFFAATSSRHGIELWRSDGSEEGTRMVHDVSPGPPSSKPQPLAVFDERLVFLADDGLRGAEPWALPLGPSGCVPSDETLCLQGGRYRVEVVRVTEEGEITPARAEGLTPDSGYFWFFDRDNVEVLLKVLDGRTVNGHVWVFFGSLSDLEYVVTVTDTASGATRRYVNPPGTQGSVGDAAAFGPGGASLEPATTAPSPRLSAVRTDRVAAGACVPTPTRLCLGDGRFAVAVTYDDPRVGTGSGRAAPLTADTGTFWFFQEENLELVVKVLDGRGFNGHHWVFYGGLSDVGFTLEVTDTESGRVRRYENPSGTIASRGDAAAFPDP